MSTHQGITKIKEKAQELLLPHLNDYAYHLTMLDLCTAPMASDAISLVL
jgi:hypothetical protein